MNAAYWVLLALFTLYGSAWAVLYVKYAHEQGRLIWLDRAAVVLVLGAALVLTVVVIGVIHGGETTCAADVKVRCYR